MKALARVRRVAVGAFAVIGVVTTGLVIGGVAYDYLSFDQTSGGYEAPYTDFTGTPVDWDAAARTNDGFLDAGLVVDTRLNCSTGLVTFTFYGVEVPFRVMSNRALVVHRPVEACEEYGFEPDFSASTE